MRDGASPRARTEPAPLTAEPADAAAMLAGAAWLIGAGTTVRDPSAYRERMRQRFLGRHRELIESTLATGAGITETAVVILIAERPERRSFAAAWVRAALVDATSVGAHPFDTVAPW